MLKKYLCAAVSIVCFIILALLSIGIVWDSCDLARRLWPPVLPPRTLQKESFVLHFSDQLGIPFIAAVLLSFFMLRRKNPIKWPLFFLIWALCAFWFWVVTGVDAMGTAKGGSYCFTFP